MAHPRNLGSPTRHGRILHCYTHRTPLGAGREGAGTTEILTSLATAFAVVGNRDSGFPLVGNATNRVGIRCRMPEPGMSETLTMALIRCSRK